MSGVVDARSLYIVYFPPNIELPRAIPRYSSTYASRPDSAVSNVALRFLSSGARPLMDSLRAHNSNGSLDRFAFLVPKVELEDGGRLRGMARKDYRTLALAEEMARVHQGEPADYISAAFELVRESGVRL